MLSPLSVLCMYDFRTDHMVLDNQLDDSSLGKTNYLTLSIPRLTVDLCLGLETRVGGFPLPLSMSVCIVLVQVLFRQPYR